MHGLLLFWRLTANDAVPQVSKILQEIRTHTRYNTHSESGVWAEASVEASFTFSLSRMRPNSGRDMDHWFLQSSKMMMFNTVDSICAAPTAADYTLICVCEAKGVLGGRWSSHLLDHLRVLLHDVQKAVIRCHGSRALLGGARQLLEQVGDYVV